MSVRSDTDQTFGADGSLLSSSSVQRDTTIEVNAASLQSKATAALAANTSYLGHVQVQAGTLTTAQLSNAVRQLTDQVDRLSRQNNALIRLLLNQLDDISDT